MMPREHDHILMIGFGGPAKPEEVKPFLEMVTRGIPIPQERLDEVLHHYKAIGGASPYNEYTLRLFEKLKEHLYQHSISLPLFLSMRHWHPFLKDTISEIKKKGLKKGIGIILAPQRSDASHEKYIRNVEEAKQMAGAPEMEYDYVKPWHDHRLFIAAQTDQVRKIYDYLNSSELAQTHLLFTAHSIPVEMAQKSKYVEEVYLSSALVAAELQQKEWSVAYQSRSGSPHQPWLEPDVSEAIGQLPCKGISTVLIVPIGFTCDNAEILYDLDIEARQVAEKLGLKYLRASTVMDHPLFVAMFTSLIQDEIAKGIC